MFPFVFRKGELCLCSHIHHHEEIIEHSVPQVPTPSTAISTEVHVKKTRDTQALQKQKNLICVLKPCITEAEAELALEHCSC